MSIIKLRDISPFNGDCNYFYKQIDDLNGRDVELKNLGSYFWAVGLSWILIFSYCCYNYTSDNFFGVSFYSSFIFLLTWHSRSLYKWQSYDLSFWKNGWLKIFFNGYFRDLWKPYIFNCLMKLLIFRCLKYLGSIYS